MKTLYIECNMGIAGDMLLAALLDLLPDPEGWVKKFNALGIPGVQLSLVEREKCGILGKGIEVSLKEQCEQSHDLKLGKIGEVSHHDHHHHGRGLEEIRSILQQFKIPEHVRRDTLAIYQSIAEAESKVHGKPVEQVHFHEIGMMDAVVDVLGVSLLLDELKPERILASPVHLGSGQVKCAHGILPVPAPATALLLHGIPSYSGEIKGELCTPTGAALLKHYVEEFGPRPEMITEALGYGMGKKDFPIANCVRVFLGKQKGENDEIRELVCNLDDVTGEEIAYAMERLFEAGALDVYVESILMKKGRPGHKLVCLCAVEQEEKMARLILKHTPTLGVRSFACRRHRLERTVYEKETELGKLREKHSLGYGVEKRKFEYDDLGYLAKKLDLSLYELREKLRERK